MELIFLLFFWLLFGIAAAIVATNKARSGCGWFIIGILLGPFGLLFALLVKSHEPAEGAVAAESTRPAPAAQTRWDSADPEKHCPDCAERIKAQARVCRYCGHQFSLDEVRRDVESAREAFLAANPGAVPWLGKNCPACGTENGPAMIACRHCGEGLQDVPVQEKME